MKPGFARVAIAAIVLALALGAFGIITESPGARVLAQTAAGPAAGAAFEVASIKQNKSVGARRDWRPLPGGRFTATSMSLRDLIRIAYGFSTLVRPAQQIVGGPNWIGSDRFDIMAKAEHDFPADADQARTEMLGMLRTLLEARFKLKTHTESRELPIYVLMKARKDGSLGPQLTRSTLDCAALAGRAAAESDASTRCGISSPGPGVLVARGVPIAQFVAFLQISPAVGRIVRDRTDLTGAYDLRVEYTPPLVVNQSLGALVANPDADTGQTLMTALPEQLGLKLDAQKGMVDVLVIDHVEPLTEDRP